MKRQDDIAPCAANEDAGSVGTKHVCVVRREFTACTRKVCGEGLAFMLYLVLSIRMMTVIESRIWEEQQGVYHWCLSGSVVLEADFLIRLPFAATSDTR